MPVSREEWEQAEVARSRIEAGLTGMPEDATLRATHTNCGRFLDPSPDTPFPLEYAYAILGDVKNRSVVDYGCGDGMNTLVLAARGARVRALDISPDLIEIAKRRIAVNQLEGQVEFLVRSAYETGLPSDSVDVVFGMAILHHLDLELASREVWRILKPGGRAIFGEPVRNLKVMSWVRGLIPYRAPDVSPFERPLTDRELGTFGAAFTSCRSRPFLLPTTSVLNLFPPLRHRFGLRALRLDAALLRRLPALTSLAAMRVVELVK